MLTKTEKKIFKFIKGLPTKYLIGFWTAIAIFAIRYVLNFILPLLQRRYIDEALVSKSIYIRELNILMVCLALSVLLLWAEYFLFRKLKTSLYAYIFKETVTKITQLPKNVISAKGTGYYNNIVVNLTAAISNLISPAIFEFFFSALLLIFVNTLLFQWHRGLFLVFCFAYVLCFFNTVVFYKQRKKYLILINENTSILSSEANDLISNTFTIKILNVVNNFTAPLWQIVNKNRHYQNKFQRAIEYNRVLFSLIQSCSLLIMLIFVLDSIFKSKMTYGQLVALLLYFGNLFQPFNNYVTFLGDMTNYGSWLDRYEESFKEQIINQEPLSNLKIYGIHSVSFRNVVLPNSKNKCPLSLCVDKPVGLVGLSGEGKTSLLKLLYKETNLIPGLVILNDSIDLGLIDNRSYFNEVNILSQDVEIFNKDLNFNILLGRELIDSNVKNNVIYTIRGTVLIYLKTGKIENEIYKNTLQSLIPLTDKINRNELLEHEDKINCITEKIFNLHYVIKDNYLCVINNLGLNKIEERRLGEKGSYLSGGEKQKIATARFLLKNNFSFFILDEPFVSLDAINAEKIISLVKNHVKGKNGILITHSMHVYEQFADYFFVIHEGKLIEQGSFEQLLKKNGLFKRLYKKYYMNLQGVRNSHVSKL